MIAGDRVKDMQLCDREGVVWKVCSEGWVTVNWTKGWPQDMQTTFRPDEAAKLVRLPPVAGKGSNGSREIVDLDEEVLKL